MENHVPLLLDCATYGQRLRQALTRAGKSRKQLALALGISEQAVGNIVNGGPKTYFMANNSAEAAAVLGVDHYWLATGKGQMELRGSDWPFQHVELHEVQALSEPERLQLEGALRFMLSQLWQLRHPGEATPYKTSTVLPGQGPREAVSPDLRALAERTRQLEDAVRAAADQLRGAVDPVARKDAPAS